MSQVQHDAGVGRVRKPSGRDEVPDVFGKRFFSEATREKYASRGVAMDDGSFPIPDKDALMRAIKLRGHAKDPAAALAHIKRRAKALGCSELVADLAKKSPFSSGIMVCLYPAEGTADWSKEEPPHLTLVYSGTVDDDAPPPQEALLIVARTIADTYGVQTIPVDCLGKLGEKGEANVVHMKCPPDLAAMRAALVGYSRSQYVVFKPHVTIDNDGDEGGMDDDPPESITFDRIAVHYGEDVTVFPLGSVAKTAKVYSARFRAKQKLYRRKVRPLKIDNPIAAPSAPNPLVIKAHKVPRKCKFCAEPCTKGVLWCEGRARVPVCDAHVKTAIKNIGGQSEVDGIQDLTELQKREDMRVELRKGMVGRFVRGGASIAAAMTPDELSRRSKKGWEHRPRASHLGSGKAGHFGMSASGMARHGIKPPKAKKLKLPDLPEKGSPARDVERAVMRRTAARDLNQRQRMAYDERNSAKKKIGRLASVVGDLAAESAMNSDIFRAYLEGKGIPPPPKYGSLHDPAKRAAMRRYISTGETTARKPHKQFKITHDELLVGEKNRMKRDREKAIMERRKTRLAEQKQRREEQAVASMGTGKIVPGKTVPELDAVAHDRADMEELDRRERQRQTVEQSMSNWTPEKQARLEQLQRERMQRHAAAEAKAAAKPVKRPAKKKADAPAPDVPAPEKKPAAKKPAPKAPAKALTKPMAKKTTKPLTKPVTKPTTKQTVKPKKQLVKA